MPGTDLHIIVDNGIPFIRGVLDDVAKVTYLPSHKIDHKAARKAHALVIRTAVQCDAELLEGTPVRFIASATIGYDHIDTDYCENQGIEWSNAPGCNSGAVDQYVLSALLHLMKKNDMTPEGLVIGIVGVGHVGSKVEKSARNLGMRVLLNDPPRARREGNGRFVPLTDILERSDIVTLHVPLTREGEYKTLAMAGRSFFGKIAKPVWFINTSRGRVVDEQALQKAIGEGIVAESVIDVWDHEPLVDQALLKKVTYGTPHIAGYSTEGKANGTAACVRSLSRHFGLELDHWYPDNLPRPAGDHFGIDITGKSELDILAEAVQHTYDITSDDRVFRESPGDFSRFRDHYPYRREPSFYHIQTGNIPPPIILKLKRLGFGVV